MAKDLRTRYESVYVRHRKGCAAPGGARCTCRPGFMARVYDRSQGRHIPSPTLRSAEAARNWRDDTRAKLDRGELPDARAAMRFAKAVESFVEAARQGTVLNKHGRRYKRSAVADLENALTVHAVPVLGGKRLSDVRRGDCQRLVDKLAPNLSGSRVRSVVNAIRSLYRWAQDRELVGHDPAALVRLPAMNATPRDRVATPAEFVQLLERLAPDDAVVFALAAYASARVAEIQHVLWEDLDLDVGVVLLGADDDGRKSAAAMRPVPLVRPLWTILRAEHLRQGRPGPSAKVCPPRKASESGLLSCAGVQRRARLAWGTLDPLGLHDARHTAATWLNAAGVNPKVASQIMGHSTPERAAAAAAGAAPITLARYTHTLPGDLERARELLDEYLAREAAQARKARES